MPKSKEFVSSSEDSDSEADQPKPKKVKKEDSKPKESPKKELKESPKKKSSAGTKGKNGETMFQIAKMRYVTVSEFRGKVMVGIREFYEKDGEMLPGKKGISLPMDQWKKFKDQMDDIEEAVKELS